MFIIRSSDYSDIDITGHRDTGGCCHVSLAGSQRRLCSELVRRAHFKRKTHTQE